MFALFLFASASIGATNQIYRPDIQHNIDLNNLPVDFVCCLREPRHFLALKLVMQFNNCENSGSDVRIVVVPSKPVFSREATSSMSSLLIATFSSQHSALTRVLVIN